MVIVVLMIATLGIWLVVMVVLMIATLGTWLHCLPTEQLHEARRQASASPSVKTQWGVIRVSPYLM
jgi:UPF0716 family protein affecting phage T7 exclusion